MGQTRTFMTYDNREKEINGGDYGSVEIDQDAEVAALMEAVESGVTQVREPVYMFVQATAAEPMILAPLMWR